MAYCCLCLVTDYDCWMDDPAQHVSVDKFFATYQGTLEKAQNVLTALLQGPLRPTSDDIRQCFRGRCTDSGRRSDPRTAKLAGRLTPVTPAFPLGTAGTTAKYAKFSAVWVIQGHRCFGVREGCSQIEPLIVGEQRTRHNRGCRFAFVLHDHSRTGTHHVIRLGTKNVPTRSRNLRHFSAGVHFREQHKLLFIVRVHYDAVAKNSAAKPPRSLASSSPQRVLPATSMFNPFNASHLRPFSIGSQVFVPRSCSCSFGSK